MASRKVWSLVAFLPFLAFGIAFPVAFGGQPAKVDGQPIPVIAMQIPEFKRGEGPVFGKLQYVSGLVLATKNGEMGAVSTIRLLDNGTKFISVMDTGHWATGTIARDKDGKLTGVGDYRITPLKDPTGRGEHDKDNLDSESLAMDKDHLYVGFEGYSRINTYPYPGFEQSMPTDVQLPILPPGVRLKHNGGMECILKTPDKGPLKGALMFVAEKTYNKEGNFIAGVQSGPMKGSFYVERKPPFDVTDGVFLENGSFLLLERSFGLMDGFGMRIRKFSQNDIKPGATIKGETLLQANFSYQIDNMEGIDAYKAADGSTHLILVSDDNHSLLERNLMLEFKLLP